MKTLCGRVNAGCTTVSLRSLSRVSSAVLLSLRISPILTHVALYLPTRCAPSSLFALCVLFYFCADDDEEEFEITAKAPRLVDEETGIRIFGKALLMRVLCVRASCREDPGFGGNMVICNLLCVRFLRHAALCQGFVVRA